MLVVLVLALAVPLSHQLLGHNVHRKLLRAVRGGPEVQPTQHERNHAQRPMWLRTAAELAWLAYLAGIVAVGLVVR